MDYFSKKYESQLAKLTQLKEEVVATPTIKMSGKLGSSTKLQKQGSASSGFNKAATEATAETKPSDKKTQ
eukprot:CAMPEP_0170462492 /NCGR_PEP_ID=MMETSP0123-20130129/7976_1 /TAXON_ID=182087 /ORGANISM="Favella ehrenbergii, Strain Fehren 1" /LENGTH=69 /DNA_ID=CAMNT_0010727723 /DNA_START=1473 /DNA_END=1682 /DNA_ORIENTATION=+